MKYTSHPAYEDGTDRVFRNVGIQQSDVAEIPKRIHTKFRKIHNYIQRTCIESLQIISNTGCIICGLDPVSMDPVHEGLLPPDICGYNKQSNGSLK